MAPRTLQRISWLVADEQFRTSRRRGKEVLSMAVIWPGQQ